MKLLPTWCKNVKIRLIEENMTVADLAKKVGLSREYVSAVVNGRIYSEPAMKAISDFLNIADTGYSLRQ